MWMPWAPSAAPARGAFSVLAFADVNTRGVGHRAAPRNSLRRPPKKRSDIDHVERIMLPGRYGSDPALSFRLHDGRAQIVVMSEATRQEFLGWLGSPQSVAST
jgi:hypothetical protein